MAHHRNLQCSLFVFWITLLALTYGQTPGSVPPQINDARCSDFNQVAEEITDSQPERYSCSSFATCNGLECFVDIFDFGFFDEAHSVSVWVLPCTSPAPSLRVTLKDPSSDIEPFDRVLSESVYVESFGDFSLNVTIIDSVEASEEIQVKIELFSALEDETPVVLPLTTFDVATTQCDISTCQAIEEAVHTAASSNFTFGDNLICHLTPRCDGFTCDVQILLLDTRVEITVSAKIVSCNDPPALQIAIENPLMGGRDLLNELFTESATVPLASELGVDGIDIIVTVDQFEEGLGVGVAVSIELLPDDPPVVETILNYQYFPVKSDQDYCDVFSPTCLALEGVVDKADRTGIQCNTTEECDGVLCAFDLLQTGVLFPATAYLIPCNKPMPAVDIQILDPSNNKVVFGRRVVDSEKITFFGFEIDILVEHLENSLGFEITVIDTNSEPQTEPIQAIRYSVIPVNTTLCKDSGVGRMQPISIVSVVMATIAVILGSFN